MGDLALSKPAPAWRAQQGEEPHEHLQFLHWALMDGPLIDDLAGRFQWAERRAIVESYESLENIPPGEQAIEAAITRVQITLLEVQKLRDRAMSNPDNVLSSEEIMRGIEWMTRAASDYAERRAQAMDWGSLTPEEREVMLQAKSIQDRLLGRL